MDMAINQPFKKYYKECFASWRASTHHEIVRPTRSLITNFATQALAKVNSEEIEFNKLLVPALSKNLAQIPIESRAELRLSSSVITESMVDASAIASRVSQLSIVEESLEPNQVPRLPTRVPVKNRISPTIAAKAMKSAIESARNWNSALNATPVQECCYCTRVNLTLRECSEPGCLTKLHHMCAIEEKGEENDNFCAKH